MVLNKVLHAQRHVVSLLLATGHKLLANFNNPSFRKGAGSISCQNIYIRVCVAPPGPWIRSGACPSQGVRSVLGRGLVSYSLLPFASLMPIPQIDANTPNSGSLLDGGCYQYAQPRTTSYGPQAFFSPFQPYESAGPRVGTWTGVTSAARVRFRKQ